MYGIHLSHIRISPPRSFDKRGVVFASARAKASANPNAPRRAEARGSAGGVLGAPRTHRKSIREKHEKSRNFEIFRVFSDFLSCRHPVQPGRGGVHPSRAEGGVCARRDTLGTRRNTLECRRCAGDTPGHSGNTFGKNMFCDFSPNLKKFWTKNVHFPKDFL